MAVRPRFRHLAVASALVAAPLVTSCSGDDPEQAAPTQPPLIAAERVDEVCEDPSGDLSTLATVQGSGSEPAGIDLVRGHVVLDEAELRVTFDTNGPIDEVPGPVFTMFQGPPALLSSWEIRAEPGDDGWATTLFTYGPGEGRVQVDQVEQPLPAVVTVEGATLELAVPRGAVPPAMTLAWVFGAASLGAASDAADAGLAEVFDECDQLFSGGAVDAPVGGPDDTATAGPED